MAATPTDAVRRIGIAHACLRDKEYQCIPGVHDTPNCKALLPGGRLFYFFDRRGGYPPQLSYEYSYPRSLVSCSTIKQNFFLGSRILQTVK